MAQTIGTSAYPITIPDFSDPADIQAALKQLHYGSSTVPANVGAITGGVAKHLHDLNTLKAPIASPVFTGTIGMPDGSITNAMLAGSIADTKLATIATALKVSNSATTATNLNTASAIVARDSSGNFAAGTITAALTGNVTGNVLGKVTQNNGSSVGKIFVQETAPSSPVVGDLWFW